MRRQRRFAASVVLPILSFWACSRDISDDDHAVTTALSSAAPVTSVATAPANLPCSADPNSRKYAAKTELPTPLPSPQEHPGLFRNKHAPGKTFDRPASVGTPLSGAASPSPAYLARQQQYRNELPDLEQSIASLPPDAQEARRAELKRSILGD